MDYNKVYVNKSNIILIALLLVSLTIPVSYIESEDKTGPKWDENSNNSQSFSIDSTSKTIEKTLPQARMQRIQFPNEEPKTESNSGDPLLKMQAGLKEPINFSPFPSALTYTPTDYTFQVGLTITNNSDFLNQASGEGWAGTGSSLDPIIITGFHFNDSVPMISISNTNLSFQIFNNYFDGQNTYDGIIFENVTNAEVISNYFIYSLKAVELINVNNSLIGDNQFNNNNVAIQLQSGRGNTIEFNHIQYNNKGINMVPETSDLGIVDTTVFNNTFFSDYGPSIITQQTSNLTIYHNQFDNTQQSIVVQPSTTQKVSNNLNIYNNYVNGFSSTKSAMIVNADNSRVVNNLFFNGQAALNITGNQLNISNNLIDTITSKSSVILSTSNSTIRHNEMVYATYGMTITANHTMITDNKISLTFVGSSYWGFSMSNLNNVTIQKNNLTQAYMYLGWMNDSVISQNDIYLSPSDYSSQIFGIYLNNSYRNILIENNIDGGSYGINVIKSAYNLITANIITRNFIGIYFKNAIIDPLNQPLISNNITLNQFSNSASRGIFLLSSINTILTNNSFFSTGAGMDVRNSYNIEVNRNNFTYGSTGIKIIGDVSIPSNSYMYIHHNRFNDVLQGVSFQTYDRPLVVSYNIIKGASKGIYFLSSDNGRIEYNTLYNNSVGIYITGGQYQEIMYNSIIENDYGFQGNNGIQRGYWNFMYNDFVNNTEQVYGVSTSDYAYNNYWSDYDPTISPSYQIIWGYSNQGPTDTFPSLQPRYLNEVHWVTTAKFITPTLDAVYNDSISIQWIDGFDSLNHSVKYELFYANQSNTWNYFGSTTGSNFTWTTLGLPEGTEYRLKIKMTDLVSNKDYNTTSNPFTLDHLVPQFTQLPVDQIINIENYNYIQICFTATDITPSIATVYSPLSYNYLSWSSGYSHCLNTYTSPQDLGVGEFKFDLIIEDELGASNSTIVIITIFDDSSPYIQTGPSNRTVEIGSYSEIFSWLIYEYSSLTYYDLYVNNNLVESSQIYGLPSQLSLAIDATAIGIFNYTIVLNDTSGNTNQDTVFAIVVDTVDPQVQSFYPILDYEIGDETYVSFLSTDADPAYYDVYINQILEGSFLWESGLAVVYTLPVLTPGRYNVTVILYDQTRNSGSFELMFEVYDTTDPLIISTATNLVFEYQTDGKYVELDIYELDPDRIVIWANGINYQTLSFVNGTNLIDLTNLEIGTYNLRFELYDNSGNYATTSSSIMIIDKILPVFGSIPQPSVSFEYQYGYSLIWGVYDIDPSYFEIFLDGELVTSDTWINEMSVVYRITNFNVRQYNITLIVYDKSGNFDTNTIMVDIIDTLAPELILYPYDASISVNAPNNVLSWVAEDIDPAYYIVSINGIESQSRLWADNSLIILNMTDWIIGEYSIGIDIYDGSGNRVSHMVNISIIAEEISIVTETVTKENTVISTEITTKTETISDTETVTNPVTDTVTIVQTSSKYITTTVTSSDITPSSKKEESPGITIIQVLFTFLVSILIISPVRRWRNS